MPNNFVGAPGCQAWWNFEPGNLLVDGLGLNDLTVGGGDPASDAADYKEGSGSVVFNGSTDLLTIPDANLNANFPLRSSDTAKLATFAFWFRLDGATRTEFFGKDGTIVIGNYFGSYPRVTWYNNSGGTTTFNLGTGNFSINVWYHVVIKIDGKTGLFLFTYYNSSTDTYGYYLKTDFPEIAVGAGAFKVGNNGGSYKFDGKMDSFVAFNRILNDFEIAKIRAFTYPPATQPGDSNFSGDAACQAVWRFEKNALPVDSLGKQADLIETAGASADVLKRYGQLFFIESECALVQAVYGATTYHLSQSDAALAAGFPFKNGDTEKKLTLCAWLNDINFSNYFSDTGDFFNKHGTNTGFRFYIDQNSRNLIIKLGTGAGYSTHDTGIVITAAKPYHIAVVLDGVAPSLYIRVYDLRLNSVSSYSDTPSGVVSANNASLNFGYRSDGNFYYSGVLDKTVVFNRLLTADEIDAVQNGAFSGTLPVANMRSTTRCETIPNALTNLSSLTTCEAIVLPRPADCRSLTISQALLEALPHACVSKTTCRPIIFDGGDFFLAF